jgi:hypothetical protein
MHRLPTVSLALVLGTAIASSAAAQVQPVDGVWQLTGKVRATACADRCATRSQPISQEIAVTNGQVTGGEGLAPGCEGGVSAEEFDGLATLVPGRRGWQRIRLVDRAGFVQLMRRCIGYRSVRVHRLGGKVRVAPDGRSFDEVVRVSGTVTVYGRSVSFSARGKVHADWARESPAPFAPLRAAPLVRVLGAALGAD